MDYKNFVRKQNTRFLNGFEKINQNRRLWSNMASRIKRTYDPLLAELKGNFEFDFFYLTETKDIPHKKNNENQNFVILYMGSHPTGITTSKGKDGGEYSHELSVEKGGQLVFSQGPQGEVLVLLYACMSEEFRFHDKYIVYKVFKSPDQVSERVLHNLVRSYFRFLYITSYVGNVNLLDRIWISYRKWRSKFDILKVGKSVFDTIKAVIELKSGIIN